MTEYCRLCAELKDPDEIVVSIDAAEQLVERKLRVCCDWTAENIEHQLPYSVCSICLDKLDKCWLFAQSVQLAQQRLLEIFENEIDNEVKPLETIIIAPLCESPNFSNSVSTVINTQCNNMLAETSTHQHRLQECKISNQDESIFVDFKAAPMESTKFQCDTESDEFQGFDNDPDFDNASNHSDRSQTVPTRLDQQSNVEIKPNRQQQKGKNKVENKTRQTKEKVANGKQYACDKCDRTFSCTTNLKKHQHMHTGQRPYECPLCSKSYVAKSALNHHLVAHVQRSKGELKIEETPNGLRIIQPDGNDSIQFHGHIWKCDQCDRIFTQKYKQKEHQLVKHSSQLPYECWLCHKLYKTHGRVKAHIKTHIPDGIKLNWICELCGKGFGGPLALANHTKMIHSTERPWRCEVCGLGFKVECQLRRHHLTHTDVQHKCNHCEKTFRTTYSLKKHLEIHTGTIPRPFVCDFCKMGFRHKMDLKEHRRIHTGEKPYSCERCLSNFRAASTFYNHMRKVHGISMSDRKKKYMAE